MPLIQWGTDVIRAETISAIFEVEPCSSFQRERGFTYEYIIKIYSESCIQRFKTAEAAHASHAKLLADLAFVGQYLPPDKLVPSAIAAPAPSSATRLPPELIAKAQHFVAAQAEGRQPDAKLLGEILSYLPLFLTMTDQAVHASYHPAPAAPDPFHHPETSGFLHKPPASHHAAHPAATGAETHHTADHHGAVTHHQHDHDAGRGGGFDNNNASDPGAPTY